MKNHSSIPAQGYDFMENKTMGTNGFYEIEWEKPSKIWKEVALKLFLGIACLIFLIL